MTAAIEVVPGTLIFPDLVTAVTAEFPISWAGVKWRARIAIHSVGGGVIMVTGDPSFGLSEEAKIDAHRWAREVAARVLPYRSGITVAPT